MSKSLYTEDHEWIRLEDGIATVGISNYAQEQLGDVVFVELPAVGAKFAQGAEVAVVESVKAASEIYCPASGEIVDVNTSLEEEPINVNQGAETTGWFFKIRLSNPDELKSLMDETAYAAYVAGLA